MTISGIWTRNKEGWRLRRPHGFPDEATLHDLIEETPEMLPLAGSPALLILGREVPLGSDYADLLGVEASGQPVIIEIKLAKAAAAKRAVVAQILAYAAHLHGTTREQLENLLGAPVENAARSAQHQTVDPDEFAAANRKPGRDSDRPGQHHQEYKRGTSCGSDTGLRARGSLATPRRLRRP